MNNEKLEKIYNKIDEISCLIYVLKIALDNIEQPINDTTPFARLAGVIEHKINYILEKVGEQKRAY